MVDFNLYFGKQFAEMNSNFVYSLDLAVERHSVLVWRHRVDCCFSGRILRQTGRCLDHMNRHPVHHFPLSDSMAVIWIHLSSSRSCSCWMDNTGRVGSAFRANRCAVVLLVSRHVAGLVQAKSENHAVRSIICVCLRPQIVPKYDTVEPT